MTLIERQIIRLAREHTALPYKISPATLRRKVRERQSADQKTVQLAPGFSLRVRTVGK